MTLLGTILLIFVLGSSTIAIKTARASDEIVSSDLVSDPHVALSTIIYKDTGELDTNFDYYALKVRVDDLQNRGPMGVRLRIFVPSYAVELGDHQPLAGSGSESCITFSFFGITFPMCYGGGVTDYTTGITSSGGLLRYVEWYQHWSLFENCPNNRFTDYGEYAIGLRVPEGAGVFAYVKVQNQWDDYWLCNDGAPYWDYLHWSFATSSVGTGGADGFRAESVRGVPDAPDLGSEFAIQFNQVAGVIGGLTGQGDTTPDDTDRYVIPGSSIWPVWVHLYVNGQNLDLCLETPTGDVCSRNPGTSDEEASYYDPGLPTIKIRVINMDGAIPANAYELAYGYARPG